MRRAGFGDRPHDLVAGHGAAGEIGQSVQDGGLEAAAPVQWGVVVETEVVLQPQHAEAESGEASVVGVQPFAPVGAGERGLRGGGPAGGRDHRQEAVGVLATAVRMAGRHPGVEADVESGVAQDVTDGGRGLVPAVFGLTGEIAVEHLLGGEQENDFVDPGLLAGPGQGGGVRDRLGRVLAGRKLESQVVARRQRTLLVRERRGRWSHRPAALFTRAAPGRAEGRCRGELTI